MPDMQVSLVAAITLDGKIAEVSDQVSLDWTSKEDKRFFVQKTKEAGVLVMGRTTYETIGRPLPGRLNIVMTRSAGDFTNEENILEYTAQSPEEILNQLSSRGFEHVVIAGGSQVYSLFVRAGLVTDYFITVEPILFGKGVPLIENISPTRLHLVEKKMLGEEAVLLHYKSL